MKTHRFTARYHCKVGELPAIVTNCTRIKVHGSFEHFLASQQTTAGRLGFLSDLASERELEPISLCVSLSGVDVPIYDLS